MAEFGTITMEEQKNSGSGYETAELQNIVVLTDVEINTFQL